MLGKVIGAVAGRKVSQHISGMSGPGGVVMGVAAAALMRRMGPMGMVAAAVGGWALKRHFAKQEGINAGTAPTR
jgi:hypothetical protein